MKCHGFKDEAEALAWKGNPVDNLEPLAKAGIPLIHVVGDKDNAVPVAENTAIIEERYKALKGEITVFHKPNTGHHPHGKAGAGVDGGEGGDYREQHIRKINSGGL